MSLVGVWQSLIGVGNDSNKSVHCTILLVTDRSISSHRCVSANQSAAFCHRVSQVVFNASNMAPKKRGTDPMKRSTKG